MPDVSRAGLFAQAMIGGSSERIAADLRDVRAVLGIQEQLVGTRLGQIGILTATSIVCRLGPLAPNLYLDVPPDARVLPGVPLLPCGEPLGETLLSFARRLAAVQPGLPKRARADRALHYDYGLFIGGVTVDTARPITVGADGWLGAVRADGQYEAINSAGLNPFGIILAAALGSAEMVKHMWLPIHASSIVMEPIEERIVVSAYDLSINPCGAPNPALPTSCQLGHAVMLGLGATGSACMFALGCLPGLEMSVDLVDPDKIERTNEERLFTGSDPQTEIGQPKAVHAQQFIQRVHSGVSAFAYVSRFQDYVDAARDRLGYVLCCLDRPLDRAELQTELPSVVANGGTDGSRWVFSWHDQELYEYACLRDLYPVRAQQAFGVERELAKFLGCTLQELRRIARAGAPMDPNQLRALAACARNPAQARALNALRAGNYPGAIAQVCSTLRPSPNAPAATISFVSVLPAIAMVADLVKRRVYNWRPKAGEANTFHFDALRHPGARRALTIRAGQHCECQSDVFRRAAVTRQRLRQPYLERMFAERTALPAAGCERLAKVPDRRRPHGLVRQAPPGLVRSTPRAQPAAPRATTPRAPPRPLLRGWRAVACYTIALLLWLLAAASYGASLIAALLTVGFFVSHESGGECLWRPWRLIPLAWNAPLSPFNWAKYVAISSVPMAFYGVGMPTTMLIVRAGCALHERTIPLPQDGPPLQRRAVLPALYGVPTLPLVWIGMIALLAISVRCVLPVFASVPCCAVFLVPFAVFLVLAGTVRVSLAPIKLARALHRRLFRVSPG